MLSHYRFPDAFHQLIGNIFETIAVVGGQQARDDVTEEPNTRQQPVCFLPGVMDEVPQPSMRHPRDGRAAKDRSSTIKHRDQIGFVAAVGGDGIDLRPDAIKIAASMWAEHPPLVNDRVVASVRSLVAARQAWFLEMADRGLEFVATARIAEADDLAVISDKRVGLHRLARLRTGFVDAIVDVERRRGFQLRIVDLK